ncbi:hypothetical protein AMR72_15335 [Flavobacterium psychrophilum]|nr:hypothetical protein AMR72_15335 [Flavobacterium psychrophilum]AOE53765.1 hypothetical protein ALW18_15325 [Flavobacterium psychrophilum]
MAILKTVEYTDKVGAEEIRVKLSVRSIPEDLEIANLDMDEYREFTFLIRVTTDPLLDEAKELPEQLVYIIENGGEHRMGTLVNDNFEEIEETRFLQGISVHALQVLLLAGDAGHFKS